MENKRNERANRHWIYNIFNCGRSEGLAQSGATNRREATLPTIQHQEEHPKRLFATKKEHAAEILDKFRHDESIVPYDDKAPEAFEAIFRNDAVMKQQLTQRRHRREYRSLSMPRTLENPRDKNLARSRLRRSESIPRTYPNAEFPFIGQNQIDDRRHFRQEFYELHLLWKAQKEEKKREARLQYMRQTTCLKKPKPKVRFTTPPANLEPETGGCWPMSCKRK